MKRSGEREWPLGGTGKKQIIGSMQQERNWGTAILKGVKVERKRGEDRESYNCRPDKMGDTSVDRESENAVRRAPLIVPMELNKEAVENELPRKD